MPEKSSSTSRQDLYRAAEVFSCPGCCKESASTSKQSTRIFVNMQQLPGAMSALVVEITQACQLLTNILELIGYVCREGSQDELHPGGPPKDEQCTVWRKEYWFAAATQPFHMIALIDLVKDEVNWLRTYLPESHDVHYLGFPSFD